MSEAMTHSVRGYIDSIDAGRVHGWVYDPANNEQGNPFYLACDDHVIAQGLANQYRADLEQAGLGNGYCSFSLSCPLLYDTLVGKRLTLLDCKGQPIEGAKFDFPPTRSGLSLRVHSFDGLNLQLRYISDKIIESKLLITVDETVVVMEEVQLSAGHGKLTFALPTHFPRGESVTLRLSMLGEPCYLWQSNFIAAPLANSTKAMHKLTLQSTREQSLVDIVLKTFKQPSAPNAESAFHCLANALGCIDYPIPLFASQEPEVSIVLPLFLPEVELRKLLGSLALTLAELNYQCVYVTDKPFQQAISHLTVIRTQSEECDALQRAIQACTAEYTLILPYSMDITADCITQLRDTLTEKKGGFTTCNLSDYSGYLIDAGALGNQQVNQRSLTLAEHCKNQILRMVDYALIGPSLYTTAQLLSLLSTTEKNGTATEVMLHWQLQLDRGYLVPHCYAFSEKTHHEWLEHLTNIDKCIQKHNVNSHHSALTKRGRVLMIDAQTPTPDSDAGSYAAVAEIKLIQALGYEIIFLPLQLSYQGNYTKQLQMMGVEICYSPYYQSVAQALSELLPQIEAVYITRHYVASQCIDFIRSVTPNTPILFNNADLHFLRETRMALSLDVSNEKHKNQQQGLLQEALRTKQAELGVMEKVDVILSYNDAEHAIITSHILTQNKIFKCPWILEEKTRFSDYQHSHGIAFLGGYKHWPNVEAMNYFFNDVFPRLYQADPNIEVYLYGSHMPDSFKEFAHPNVHLVGFLPDLDELFLQHRVFIAPLQSGAGIKGKVLESASYGLPSVLSPIAAESTGLTHQISALIAETPEEWVAHITQLYHNRELWHRLSLNARILAKELYSFEHGKKRMQAAFRYVGL